MSAKDTSSTLLVDFDKTTLNTEYCVELWQRDLQIELNLRRVTGRLEYTGDTPEPVAVVAFGPSLLHTWEGIRKFNKIITCSGALPFLLERGIVPTWHIEVDPRPHKAQLMGAPHPDVEYLLASCTNPIVFDLLDRHNCKKIKLWHIFADEQFRTKESYPFPKGEWMFTGGTNAGLRAMVIARFLGHWDQTVFGIDGSFAPDRTQHAGFHPKEFDHVMVVPTKYGDYLSNPGMIQSSRAFVHELAQISNLKLTMTGDGLMQATLRAHQEQGRPIYQARRTMMAMQYEKTISDDYLAQNKKLHEINPAYGVSGVKYAPQVKELAEKIQALTVLDYGCGKSTLAAALPFPIWEYDPAIPGKEANPKPADLLVCTDVLEHIEPDYLDRVLKDLVRCTLKKAYIVVSTVPAIKTLPDGRNTHLIVQPMEWWRNRLEEYFDIERTVQGGVGADKIPTTAKFTCVLKKDPVPVEVAFEKDPKKMWVSDLDKAKLTKLEEAPPVAGTMTADAFPTITVEAGPTVAKFINVNQLTKWRAETLLTKEPSTIEWIEQMEKNSIFYDVGANMGGYSVWAAKRRDAEVYAFEPESGNYALLCRNLVINQIRGEAFCIALTDQPTVGRLFTSANDVGGSCHSFNAEVGPNLQPRPGVAQGCMGHRLDDLVQAGLPTPNYIKIDVDGFEHKVIEGARRTLARPELKSVCVEINTNLVEHRTLIEKMLGMGFNFDVDQVERAKRKSGPFEGCAEFIFTAKGAVSSIVVAQDEVEKYVLGRIEQAQIIKRPFPHIYINGLFPPEFYRTLMAALPPETSYVPIELARGVKGYPQRFVRATDKLEPWATLSHWMTNGTLRKVMCAKFGVQGEHDETLLIKDLPGYAIGPHTDSTKKVISALIYLPKDDTLVEAGTTMFMPKDAGFTCKGGPHYPFDDFYAVETVPFAPNSMFAFPKSSVSFHGVKPFNGPGARDVLLYDIQL